MEFLNRRAIAAYVLIVFLVALMTGCGGGGQSSADKKAAVTVTVVDIAPNPTISLEPGQVVQVFAQALNSSGNQVFTQTITFNSSSSAIDITPTGGLLCAGKWDNLTTPVVCNPATVTPTVGVTSNITASAGGVTSPTTVASIHVAVKSVTVTPQITPPLASIPACVNEAKTQIYKAVAKDSLGNDVTATVGGFTWQSTRTTVATIPFAGDTGIPDQATATAVHPGDSNIIASIGSVSPTTSAPVIFEQCLVKSIVVSNTVPTPPANDTLSHFEIATGATRPLTVVVKDSTGTALTTLPTLNWNTTQPSVATVSASTTGATVNSIAPGTVGISASCQPDNCNTGTKASLTSNLVTGTISGTAPTTANVYVTCTDPAPAGACNTGTAALPQVKLFPISGTTLGTAITLPHTPNSMVINPQSSRIYIGSAPDSSDLSAGLMVVDASANAFSSTTASAPGKVLAVAPNGNAVAVSNGADVFLFNGNTATALLNGTTHILNATAAAFSQDGGKLYIATSTGEFWVDSLGITPTVTASAFTSPTDMSFLPSGTFAMVATSGGLRPIQTCTDSVLASVASGAFEHVVGVPTTDASHNAVDSVVATLAPDIHRIDFAVAGTGTPAGCPFTISASDNSVTTPGFTANQLLLSPDSTHAFVVGGANVIDYNIAANTFVNVVLSSGDAKSGGATANGAVYVGGGADQKVHVITAGVEGAPISATIPADLVVAKSK